MVGAWGPVDTADPVTRDLLDRVAKGWLAPNAVGLRQVPATLSIAVALLLLEASTTPARPGLLVLAAGMTGAAQLAGAVGRWDRWPVLWRAAPPLAQMAAVALLDLGGGLPQASFDVLLLLPMGTLALRPERWGPAIALGACAAVLLAPAVVDVDRVRPLLHAVVTFLVLAPVVLGAHGIVQTTRLQAVELRRARDSLDVRARQLQDSRDVLRSIMQAATGQAIFAVDAEGVILSASTGAERIFGRRPDDLIGSDVAQLVADDPLPGPPPGDPREATAATGPSAPDAGTREAALRRLTGAAAEGATHVEEWRTVRPDGSVSDIETVVTARPALAGAGPELPSGYLVVATDVTSRHDEQRQQDEFIGLVTHELRTPLASILGYLELVRLGDGGLDDDQRRYLEVIERNANRLRSLVEDLLASAQLVVGAQGSVEELDVLDVVEAAVAGQAPIAATANVHVEVTGDAPVPLVSDPQRLTQIVDNLLSNAVKYSFSGGRVVVEVRAGRRDDGARLARVRVVDEGTGIEPDELSRLTERFYRTRDTRRRRVRGVGLGLSLVQAIVDAHGGRLTIDSRPGAGTQVEVELPDLHERP